MADEDDAATAATATAAAVIVQLQTGEGVSAGPPLTVPLDVSPQQLETLINRLLSNEEELPYSFFVGDDEVVQTLRDTVAAQKLSTENVLTVVYQPQAVFRVRSVTRCSASMTGHAEAVLSVAFSPDGQRLASGSGDTTVRIWDILTQTPEFTCRAHSHWVLCIAWSPDGKRIASGGADNKVQLWDPATGQAVGTPLTGHRGVITSLSWEPLHRNGECSRLASSSKDGTVKVWDVLTRRLLFSLSGHSDAVSCVRWGGDGLIYTASRDRAIHVYDAADGKLCRSLTGHAHWVNTLALNTDYVLRTGAFDHTGTAPDNAAAAKAKALERYQAVRGSSDSEVLVSGSDDFTLFMWTPAVSKKPIARLTGHQQVVNQVVFSPDGRYLASASFDKSVKLWDGRTGKFITSLRAHVGAVYQVAWSADSRMLVSGSKDSTMKVWDVRTKKVKFDLPGHADEVYTVDWSPDGERVASGGKDKVLKLWVT